MDTKKKLALAALLLSSAVGCVSQNKVLVGQQFIGEERTVKVLMTVPEGDGENRVVDQLMRICTLKAGKEVDCKDTLVLENVNPGSLY